MLKYWTRGTASGGRSSRNSTVFSVEEDLTEIDRQVRQNLEQHFRPVFQRFVYGGERIASHDLRRLLHDDFYRDLLPPDKVYELIDLVDFNPGKAISYTEFVRIVTGGYDTENYDVTGSRNQLTDTPKTWLNTVCRNTVQQGEVDEYLKHYRWIPPPFFMVTISLVQFVVFIYYAVDIYQKAGVYVGAIDVVPAYSPLMYLQEKRHEPWRFVTYMFLHQGALDMLFNVCLQVILGFPLEVMFGWWRMATLYLIGVITGSLAQSVCDHYVGLAGAAGGCYAVVFGHVLAIFVNWSELDKKGEKRAKKWWGRPPFRLFLIFLAVLIQISLAIFRRFYPGYPQYKVGVAAHGGGLVAGLLLGRSFVADSVSYPWQQSTFWIDIFTVLIFIAACVIFNIVYKGYPEAVYD